MCNVYVAAVESATHGWSVGDVPTVQYRKLTKKKLSFRFYTSLLKSSTPICIAITVYTALLEAKYRSLNTPALPVVGLSEILLHFKMVVICNGSSPNNPNPEKSPNNPYSPVEVHTAV